MKYPIMTLIDGTEVTASDIDKDGNLQVYIEKWNPVHDAFDHFTMVLPKGISKENVGFTTEEIAKLAKHIRTLKNDIIDFVKEKEERECRN